LVLYAWIRTLHHLTKISWRLGRGETVPLLGFQVTGLFSFLTYEANGVVGPIHPKAMPVMLTTPEEWSTWLAAPTEIALELQRPLPDAMMRIVATGSRRDPAE
jgi:putative SOS response-associated peptidase YedK